MRIISGILNLVGYCILALFLLGAGLISIAIFFASLVVPVIFLWEWGFIGEEKLRVAEKFLIRENVYEQMIEVSFSPDRDSQTVIAELRPPSRNFLMNPEISNKMNKFQIINSMMFFVKCRWFFKNALEVSCMCSF